MHVTVPPTFKGINFTLYKSSNEPNLLTGKVYSLKRFGSRGDRKSLIAGLGPRLTTIDCL